MRNRRSEPPLLNNMNKERRPSFEHRQRQQKRTRCLVAAVTILGLIGVLIIGAAVYLYIQSLQAETETRENNDYMRKLVRQINDAPNITWKAKFNKFGIKKKSYGFQYTRNATAVQEYFDEITKFYNSEQMKQHLKQLADYPDADVPKSFDARMKWPHCPSISNIPNQGGCGSCFAVAAVGVAADRACIHSNGTHKALFSEEDVLGCCSVCGNCYGGDPLKALTYWVNEGLVTGGRDGCRPYSFDRSCGVPCSPATFFDAEQRRTCVRRCQNIYYQNSYDEDKHYASFAYSLYPRSMTISADGTVREKVPTIIGHFNSTATTPLNLTEIRTILMKEISMFGPTTMAFPVPEEFLSYASGVFRPFPNEDFNDRIIYWHVVRLIGWGYEEDGSHYWLAINSFGNHWGDGGSFKINTDSMEKYGLEYETAL
ncbi:unnamed protein product [Auanema sp. JU1783]|nr:unnamed protein product [Auanema sp. JU1783]